MSAIDRFMAKVDKQADGCWIWTACGHKTGYGRFGLTSTNVEYSHRAAWRLMRGPIPARTLVCHTCDVRLCVNPDHLFLGSHHDNMRDASNKGRVVIPRASYCSDQTHQPAKLTNAQALAIRQSQDSLRVLARRYGVSKSAVHRVRTGVSFRGIATWL
jgi:hypothetical protein